MSFAPQNQAPDVSDALDGSLTSWYDNVNNCLKTSECVPGHYEYSQAPSYGNQCPIQEGGSTKIDIGCNRFEIVDINNSYIDAEFTFPLQIPTQKHAQENLYGDNNPYYIGFKSSYDVIDQYRIYSNGDLIYTQNHANYEGFLNYISLTDSAKENSPCFATLDKIRSHNPNVPGTYLYLDNITDETVDIKLTFKIPLNAFPILQNLKYFPGFMGKLQIEIYPSYKNLVWAAISPDLRDSYCTYAQGLGNQEALDPTLIFTNVANNEFNPLSIPICSFNQINTSVYNRFFNDTAAVEDKVDIQTFACSSSTLTKFHLYQAVYMIKMDIYNALEMNYLQIPLLFPIQTVSNTKFTYPMGTSPHFTLQNTATLSHCDTVFIVFPKSANERTVSFNPHIKAQLSINSKYYPREQLSTAKNDPKFVNLIYDALNINNNPLMTPGNDIINSLNIYSQNKTTIAANNLKYDLYLCVNGDQSNFVFAVPLSTDEDFMGGISSNGSTVQIELIGYRDSLSELVNNYEYTEAPVAIFLEDKLLKIYSMKPPGKPQIQITNATLDQIVASGGQA